MIKDVIFALGMIIIVVGGIVMLIDLQRIRRLHMEAYYRMLRKLYNKHTDVEK